MSQTSDATNIAQDPIPTAAVAVERDPTDWLAQASKILPWVLLIGLFVATLWNRVTQPGDLHDDDQSKTMAYTVDMVRNHQWALPRDMYRQPATKPPMYNWLTLPVLYVTQTWAPWVFKFPSLVAAISTCGLILLACWTLFSSTTDGNALARQSVASNIRLASLPAGIGVVSVAIFLSNQPVTRMMYLARPDMLLTMFLSGAWIFGTIALMRQAGSTRLYAILFWICVAGASLTKGPPALAALVYVLIAAPLFAGGWRALRRLHWWYAIPLLLLPLGLWLALGYKQSGSEFFRVIFVQELATRLTGGGPEGTDPKPWWQMMVWFFDRFSPWSVLVMAVVLGIPLRQWSRHALAPVVLWTVLVMIFFSIPGGKRADYLLPIYPPAAIACAFLLVGAGAWLGISPVRAMVVVCLVGAYMNSHPATRRVASSDPIEQFAKKIAPLVRKETLVVVNVGGYQPLLPLLGRFNGTPPIPLDGDARLRWYTELANSHWVVMPVSPLFKNVKVLSGEVPAGRLSKNVQLALYHVGEENSPSRTDLRNMYRRRINGVNSSSQVNEGPTTTQSTTRPARPPRPGARAPARTRR
jgi:4-amino-4-deoxy-L-arabinose transferase-like glycosyltransferase